MDVHAELRKVAPLTGITFAFLHLIGSYLLLKDAPEFGAEPAEIIPYFTDRASDIQVGTLLVFISAPFWFTFLGVLHNAVKAHEGSEGRLATVLVAAGSAAAAVTLVGQSCAAAGAIRAQDGTLAAGAATVYFDASYSLVFTATAVAATAFLIALALASLRYGAIMPRPLGAFSLVLGVIFLIPNIAWIVLPIGVLLMTYISLRLYLGQSHGMPLVDDNHGKDA